MDKQFTFTFSRAVKIIVDPIIIALKYTINTVSKAYSQKELVLTHGVEGRATVIGDDLPTVVEIATTIISANHQHDPETLPASIPATANTIALRDENAYLYSNNSAVTNTGYLLADGRDITTLFQTINEPYMVVERRNSGSGAAITGAWLTQEGNKLIINTSLAGYCSYWAWCRCQCCD